MARRQRTAADMYDYVIVGAGSSGSALAGRLSEDPNANVLLIEAGPHLRPHQQPEAMRSWNSGEITTEEQYVQRFQWPGLMGRRTIFQEPRLVRRGRVTGGSSSINVMCAIRGIPEDFESWKSAGCNGWSWQDVLPYFIRLEDEREFGDAPYHGRGGPVPVCRLPKEQWGPVDQALAESAQRLGYGWADDHNAPGTTGVSPYAMNTHEGERVSTADGYLEPALGRKNFTVMAESLVDSVVLKNGRATGVKVLTGGRWRIVRGTEVILSAGSFHSPAILMRSGIGPPALLRNLGIPVQLKAPSVGENLSDHPLTSVNFSFSPGNGAYDRSKRRINCCVRYSSGMSGGASNDMFLISANAWSNDNGGQINGSAFVSLYQVCSKGTVAIVSSDPGLDPFVDYRMLSDARDLERIRDGVERLFDIGQTKEFRAFGVGIGLGPNQEPISPRWDRARIERWLLGNVGDIFHPAGTCRMGPEGDPRSVVDPECRVIGVDGLRVVDASIMPEVVRANLHLTAVMIGEKAADIIKGRQPEMAAERPS